jgi:transcriptional regulator with XRE-family HTH domain
VFATSRPCTRHRDVDVDRARSRLTLQGVSLASSGSRTRHQQGVQRLKPELVQRIRDELARGPVSKSELARRLRVSRPTVIWYLKKLADEPDPSAAPVATVNAATAAARAVTHDDVLDRVTRACGEVEDQIRSLLASSTSTAAVSTAFKGWSVLERYLRLLAELRQELAPAQQNVFVQLSAAMTQDVELPRAERAGDEHAASR